MKYLGLFLAVLLLSNAPVTAQKSTSRIEYELDDNAAKTIVPLGKRGMVVLSENGNKAKGMSGYDVDFFDIHMNKIKARVFEVPRNQSIIASTQDSTGFYVLFGGLGTKSKSQTSNTFTEYTIVKVDPITTNITQYSGMTPRTLYFKKFAAMNGVAYLSGSLGVSSGEQMLICCTCYIGALFINTYSSPFILGVDFTSSRPQKKDFILNSNPKINTFIKDMDLNPEANECTFIVSEASKKKVVGSNTVKLIKDMKLGKDINLNFPKDKSIANIHINAFGDQRVFIGTYTNLTNSVGVTTNNTIGIFFGKIEDGKRTTLTTVKYQDFKQFKFLTSSTEDRALKKANKKNTEVNIAMNVIFHDILVREDEYVVMGEAYYPHYHTETTTTYDAQGRPQRSTITVFDGYVFYGAFACGFSMDGTLKWENGVQTGNKRYYFSLDPKYRFMENEDESITVIFNDGVKVTTAIIYKDKKAEVKKATPISTGNKGDTKTTALAEGDLDYWYDNYYLASGYQKVVNKSSDGKKKRKVFYINKLEIE